MLKDYNIDPLLVSVNEENGNVRDSIFGQVDFQNSQKHAGCINKLTEIASTLTEGINSPISRTTRSSHKIVTPLRQQNTSSLVASLESFSSNSQGVSQQIAKITSTIVVTPATTLANSFASLSTFDTLGDPNLLQSHVQKSLETSSSSFGLESNYCRSVQRSNTSSDSVMNSLYNTPLKRKQSKSHDFSELPSQQRLRRRRSSILGQEDENKLFEGSMNEIPLSDLSHFNADEDEANGVIPIELDIKENRMINSNESGNDFNYFDDSESEDFIEQEISPIKLSSKRPRTLESRVFTLPSKDEYKDGSKPPYSYASLIAQAIISSPKQRLALSSIYCWIMEAYPYYKVQTCGWQVRL